MIDNISVSDSVYITNIETTATKSAGVPGFELEVLVIRLALIFLLSRKQRS